MNTAGRLEKMLAALLRYGSWSASAAIGLGYALALIGSHPPTRNLAVLPNMRIASVGIVLFIRGSAACRLLGCSSGSKPGSAGN